MQFSAHQLKEKLLKGLDNDYNVVDMRGVLEVVSILESYQVTRETLEQTRLGKFVNEMRRKTSNKELAKRAKNLVRKWKQLVETNQGPAGAQSSCNGDAGVASGAAAGVLATDSPASRPCTPLSKSSLSPNLPLTGSGPATPTTGQPLTPSTVSQPARHSPKSLLSRRPGTPGLLISEQGKPSSPALTRSNSNNSSGLHSPGLSGSSHLTTSTPIPGHAQRLETPRLPQTPVTASPLVNNLHDTPVSATEAASRSHIANRKRRRKNDISEDGVSKSKRTVLTYGHDSGEPSNGQITSLKRAQTVSDMYSSCDQQRVSSETSFSKPNLQTSASVGDDMSSPLEQNSLSFRRNTSLSIKCDSDPAKDKSQTKTPKVKTTAQLIAELSATGDFRLGNSATVSKITNNLIVKEVDHFNQSVVPPEAKPRPRRTPKTLTSMTGNDQSLEQTKSEMVQKFLQSSVTPSSSEIDLVSTFNHEQPNSPSIDVVAPDSPVESLTNQNSSDSFGGNNSVINGAAHNTKAHPVMFFIGDEDLKKDDEVNIKFQKEEAALKQIIDPWSHLPPLNLSEIDWTSDDYEVKEQGEITDADIERLHSENWAGVNGLYDDSGVWHDWTATYSMRTYNDDFLHILPYVNTDS